jgi:hypothetical protein
MRDETGLHAGMHDCEYVSTSFSVLTSEVRPAGQTVRPAQCYTGVWMKSLLDLCLLKSTRIGAISSRDSGLLGRQCYDSAITE